jgi:biopolymer transport protein ExbD
MPAIYHRDQRVSLDELRQRLAQTGIRDRAVVLKADKDTPYELVVQVTDEALKLGYSVVLATSSERK